MEKVGNNHLKKYIKAYESSKPSFYEHFNLIMIQGTVPVSLIIKDIIKLSIRFLKDIQINSKEPQSTSQSHKIDKSFFNPFLSENQKRLRKDIESMKIMLGSMDRMKGKVHQMNQRFLRLLSLPENKSSKAYYELILRYSEEEQKSILAVHDSISKAFMLAEKTFKVCSDFFNSVERANNHREQASVFWIQIIKIGKTCLSLLDSLPPPIDKLGNKIKTPLKAPDQTHPSTSPIAYIEKRIDEIWQVYVSYIDKNSLPKLEGFFNSIVKHRNYTLLILENSVAENYTDGKISPSNLLIQNAACLPSWRTSIPKGDAILYTHAAKEAQKTSISQFCYEQEKLFIIIPHKSSGKNKVEKLVSYEVITGEDYEKWASSKDAVRVVSEGIPRTYSLKNSFGKGIIVIVPARGLLLIKPHTCEFEFKNDNSFKNKYSSISQKDLNDHNVHTFHNPVLSNWMKGPFYVDFTPLIKANPEIPEPLSCILKDIKTILGSTYMKLVDYHTGEAVFQDDIDKNIVFKKRNTSEYLTAASFNAAVTKSLTDYRPCILSDGTLDSLKFSHYSPYGFEVWDRRHKKHREALFERSYDGTRFCHQRAINSPKNDEWTRVLIFDGPETIKKIESGKYSISRFDPEKDWPKVEKVVKETFGDLQTLVQCRFPDGNTYSTKIFESPNSNPYVLCVLSDIKLVVALKYLNGHWFRVNPETGKILPKFRAKKIEEFPYFIISNAPIPKHKIKTFNNKNKWQTVTSAIIKANDRTGDEVLWTSPNGAIYSSQEYKSGYILNTHRLVSVSDNDGKPAKHVFPVTLKKDTWVEIDTTSGKEKENSNLCYSPIGHYFYFKHRTFSPIVFTGYSVNWDHVTRSVMSKNKVKWITEDGFVFSNEQRPTGNNRQLVATYSEDNNSRVVSIEHLTGQLWNVINPLTGRPLTGFLVKSYTDGTFLMNYDANLVSSIARLDPSTHQKPKEVTPPLIGWEGIDRYNFYDPWEEIELAVRLQKNRKEYVEWSDTSGNKYTSRIYNKMVNSRVLAEVLNTNKVWPLVQIGQNDWVVYDKNTDDIDYTKAVRMNENGTFRRMYNLRKDISSFAKFLLPEDPGIISKNILDDALIHKIKIEKQTFDNLGDRVSERHFYYKDEGYVISSVKASDNLHNILSHSSYVLKLIPEDLARWPQHYIIIDLKTGKAKRHHNKPIIIVYWEGVFGTPDYFNSKIPFNDHNVAFLVLENGQIIRANYFINDMNGNEIWGESKINSEDKKNNGAIFFRRKSSGEKFIKIGKTNFNMNDLLRRKKPNI